MRYWTKAAASLLSVFLICLLIFAAVFYWQGDNSIKEETPGKSFVWKISSPTNHIYLLGSVHVGSSDLYPLDSAIEAAFKTAKYLVVELNINDIDSNSEYFQNMVFYYALYPEGEGLKENLPADLYEQLKEKLVKMNINITSANSLRPWLIAMATGVDLGAMNYDAEYGIDVHFLNEAERTDKSILQLEGAIDQLAAISDVPDEVMVKMIISDVIFYSPKQTMDILFDAWVTGNAARLEGLLFLGSLLEPETAPYFEKLIDQRNFSWMEKIEKYLADDETYFIVVGAGH
ncbi:MAG: TraB/GumN family protein, partial [bacterium]|nr:TraB/GumN family protein [bacterium]